MSDKVVDFAAAKAEREPHWAGRCKCVGCNHEWEGVGPMGLVWFDCPSCGLPKGTFKHPFGPAEDDLAFACLNCASEAFSVYKRAGVVKIVCMGCGTNHMDNIFA